MVTLDYPVTFDVNTLNVGDRVMIDHPFIKGPFVVVPEDWKITGSAVIRPAKGQFLVMPDTGTEHEFPVCQPECKII